MMMMMMMMMMVVITLLMNLKNVVCATNLLLMKSGIVFLWYSLSGCSVTNVDTGHTLNIAQILLLFEEVTIFL
jgi:hypothetical protein